MPPVSTHAQERFLTLAIETSNPSSSADAARAGGVMLGMVSRRSGEDGPPATIDSLTVEWLAKDSTGAGVGAPGTGGVTPGGSDDALLPAIARLFERSGRSAHELDCVAVSVGPGGYTGVRVACAAGKMLAEGARARQSDRPEDQRCRCACVPSHLSAGVGAGMLCRGGESAWGGTGTGVECFVVAMAAKGASAWVSPALPVDLSERGDWSGFAAKPGRVLVAGDLARLRDEGVGAVVADGFFPKAMQEAVLSAGLAAWASVFDPVNVLRCAARLAWVDPALLNPIYPREPEAVTLWRQRHG